MVNDWQQRGMLSLIPAKLSAYTVKTASSEAYP